MQRITGASRCRHLVLSTVRSWSDTLEDDEVLEGLKYWNEAETRRQVLKSLH